MYRHEIAFRADVPEAVLQGLTSRADRAFNNRAGRYLIPVRPPGGWFTRAVKENTGVSILPCLPYGKIKNFCLAWRHGIGQTRKNRKKVVTYWKKWLSRYGVRAGCRGEVNALLTVRTKEKPNMTEQEKQREATAKLDRDREERQRSEDSRRQEEERRRQEQRRLEERRRQEQQQQEEERRRGSQGRVGGQPPEQGEHSPEQEPKRKRKREQEEVSQDQELRDLAATQDLFERLIKSGYYQEQRDEKEQGQEKEKIQSTKDSPAVERLKAKMEATKDKAREHIKAQDKGKDVGREK